MRTNLNTSNYLHLLNELPLAMGLTDIEGNIVLVNNSFFKITGYGTDDIPTIAYWVEKALPKTDNKKFWIDCINGLSDINPRSKPVEYSICCKNNSEKRIFLSFGIFSENLFAFYVSEKTSNAQMIIGQGSDKQHQKDEEYYKQIVTAANVAIVKFDTNLFITDFSGNSEKIFGFKKEEVIGRKLEDTIVPRIESTGRDLGKVINDLVYNTKSFEYNINENITKEGGRLWMQWYNSEIRDSENQLTGILSIGINITDRIHAEAALRESEERFKLLSNLTFEGILIHDNGTILDFNLSFERQIGYSREELIGENLFEKLIPKRSRKTMLENINNDITQYEAEAIHKNGSIIPISIEATSTKIGDKLVRVAAIRNISDLKRTITELDNYKIHLEDLVAKRTEEIKIQSKELKKQNEILQFERNELRTIIDNIPDLIYVKDLKSRFLNANKKQIKHLGKNELSEIIGKTDFDFYEEQYAKEYYSDEQSIFKTGVPLIDKEEPSVNEDEQKIFILTTKVPLHDNKGNSKGLVGIGRDITEKKLAENKLKIQSENLKEINIQLADRSKKIEKLNGELNNSNKQLAYANKILHERKEELETTLDQLKNAQMHLVQSEKMASLGILMAGIAHEINNPVNFVYAGVNSITKDFDDIKIVIEKINSLSKQSGDSEKLIREIEEAKDEYEFDVAYQAITETLKDIKLGASRISEIVAGLSRFSRLENEKWKKSNLHEELDSVLILLKNKYKHHIEIIKKYDNNLPVIECYPGKLNQVFMNIINNAIDAMEGKQGKITIETSSSTGMAHISISDTGKGINEEDKLKIFDPFFTTKEVGFGMGLGLSISYSIIQEHNGEIIVNSIKDQGTEFHIKIPIKQI